MNENAHLKSIFRHFNAMLWKYADIPCDSVVLKFVGEETPIQIKAETIGRESDRLQKIIAAYCEQQTTMMQGLIQESRFSKFPLPRKRIRLWMRLRCRIALWKAIHSSIPRTTGGDNNAQ